MDMHNAHQQKHYNISFEKLKYGGKNMIVIKIIVHSPLGCGGLCYAKTNIRN